MTEKRENRNRHEDTAPGAPPRPATRDVAPGAAGRDRRGGWQTRAALGYALILLAGLMFGQFVRAKASHELEMTLERDQSMAAEKARIVQSSVSSALGQVYQNLRTISMLPSVMKITRHGENLDEDARMSIQQSYNNLASNIDVSEVYVVPIDFDPERIDPATGEFEAPILMFDELITAFTDTNANVQDAARSYEPQEEVEIEEFRQLQALMGRLRDDHAILSPGQDMHLPFFSGEQVITCDNSDYNRTLRDTDRMGVMFSVPFYGADRRLKGSITAIVRSNALRELTRVADYALVNTDTGVVLEGGQGGQPGRSWRHVRAGEPDPDLLFSETLPLAVDGNASGWTLWAGHSNEAFLGAPEVARIRDGQRLSIGLGTGGTLLALFFWRMICRRRLAELAQWRDLSDASVEGLVICAGDSIVTANRSFGEIVQIDAEMLVGRDVGEFLIDTRLAARLLASDGEIVETELRGATGATSPVEVMSRAITYLGRPHRVMAVRDLRERKAAEKNIHFLAHHDSLTKLANRVQLRLELERALARGQRGESFALLCLDLDHFKQVNDTLGHPIGDALLRAVADRLRANVREGDTIARLGGDEFAIIVAEGAQPAGAIRLAERIVVDLNKPFDVAGHQVVIGVSVGIALAPNDGDDPDLLLKNADLALYRAKTDGRGVFRMFEAEMDAKMQARRQMELDLKKALALGEFELHYQPLVETNSQRITAFEALLRWRHPQRGIVSPAEFIPLAEENGLMSAIGAWVLKKACTEATQWPEDIRVAVNVSPVQFRKAALEQHVLDALAMSGLAAGRLEIEITESVLLDNTDQTLAILGRLREIGVRVSLDDFGTGYSSLSYLNRFPFDKIKIDQSFTRCAPTDSSALAIVRAVIGLGKSLGMETIAEGVETDEQYQRLRNEGCGELQGYLFSRPIPGSEIRDHLARFRQGAAAEAEYADDFGCHDEVA